MSNNEKLVIKHKGNIFEIPTVEYGSFEIKLVHGKITYVVKKETFKPTEIADNLLKIIE